MTVELAGAPQQSRDWWRIQDALIGFLSSGPLPAHALVRMLDQRLPGADMPISRVHVMLDRLSRAGLVEPLPAKRSGPGGRRRTSSIEYRATDEGLAHLRQWLRSPIAAPQLHDELLTRLVVCSRSDVPRLIELVQEQIRWCTNQSLSVQFIDQEVADPRRDGMPVDDWQTMTRVLARDCELGYWTSHLAFLEEMREMLVALRDGVRGW
jgi:DNA-binding PadR family transcriptional regulator